MSINQRILRAGNRALRNNPKHPTQNQTGKRKQTFEPLELAPATWSRRVRRSTSRSTARLTLPLLRYDLFLDILALNQNLIITMVLRHCNSVTADSC